MGNSIDRMWAPAGAVTFFSVLAVAGALAQPAAPSPGTGSPPTAGVVLGPAALPPGTIDRTCGTGPAGLESWGTNRIEQLVTLTGVQRDRFNDLKAASAKAVQYLRESCPTKDPVTPTGRLEVMQQRLEAMLEAVREVRPALDAFYATLNDEQKARLNVIEPTPETEPAAPHQRHGRRHYWRFRLPFPF